MRKGARERGGMRERGRGGREGEERERERERGVATREVEKK